MNFEFLLYNVAEGIATITFNRPKALNALSPAVMEELDKAIALARDDDEVKVVILTGAGDKAYVAGADIKIMSEFTPLMAKRFSVRGQEVLFNLASLPKPVIACVNGFALGGGNEVAMACDFIYASDKAKFGQPEINLGVIPGFGGTQRLARLVGKGLAKEICLTGGIISAQEAKEIGLVNKVFPHAELMAKTLETAKLMASKGVVALREIKQVIDEGLDTDLRNACLKEIDRFALCFTSEDQIEGMGAFLEKRSPSFKGKLA
ncbi:MAG: enoyl-CoA hydratase/isomerase family protein [Deltaproteobacteria bacterium]|nr:enoyl-CoA hydratase/isomerase family protein [Deltaproteobacteria bacterium]MBF0523860.1 enoyl-CoA hydratase/isomerase family protein [Deltaproteobacteria bacterium]